MAHPPTDRARRHEIEAIFEAAIELASLDRDRWVAQRCAGDHRLRVDVETLIAAHERTGGILERDGAAAAAAMLPEMSKDRRIGSYRVLRELGRGGMGVVYLAERDDGQYQQRVAIKVLHAIPHANELRQRFVAERQILASLKHPNVAQLLDGGIDGGQLPYLVMEYVDGEPIASYCDRLVLDIGARVRLFLDVCAAVHYAHRNLILHCDLKPANILVAGEGRQVKLLDFGVAKLLVPTLPPQGQPLTHSGTRPMTPEYASPEQVRGEPLTTATDVYSLGVVLYELLTGRRPYYLATGSPGELWEVVCSREPERPSAAVMRALPDAIAATLTSETPGYLAQTHGYSPQRLQRVLRGDLDAIVTMAIRKDAGERYESAELLRHDLQRYLDGLPVLARRGSRTYRARKFLARHRIEAAAVATVIVSLVVGAGAALRQASVAADERDRAEHARAEAEQSLKESERVTSFLVGLYNANAAATRGKAVTASDLLRRGAAYVDQLRQPLEQARMLEAMGRVHTAMANYSDARVNLERTLALRVAQLGPNHPEVARTLFYLGDVLRRTGQYTEADSLSRRALAIRTASFGARDPATAEVLAQRAALFVYRSDLKAAEDLSRRALEIRRQALAPTDSLIAISLDQHASHLRRLGRNAEAEAELRDAIAIRRTAEGLSSVEAAALELRLGGLVLETRGDTAQAESLMRSALASMRAALGDDHPRTAWAMSELADLLSLRGKHREAAQLARTALAIRRNAFGSASVFVAEFDQVLATIYIRGGRWTDAERVQREALSILERADGSRQSAYAGALGAWADALIGLARYDEAIAARRRAIEIRRNVLGEGSNLYGIDLSRLADIYARKGDYSMADSLFRVALASQARYVPTTHPDVRDIYRRIAERYRREGRRRAAEAFHRLAEPR